MKTALMLYAVICFHNAFEYNSGNPETLFPHRIALHDSLTPSVMMNPALLPSAEGLLLSAAAGRPYQGEDIRSAGSAVQFAGGDYGLQFLWNSFGTDFYRENTLSLGAGYSLSGFLHAGAAGNMHMLKIGIDDYNTKRYIADADIGVLFAPFSWLSAAMLQSGAYGMIAEKNSDIIYPERSAGVLLKPGKGFAICWNITDTAAEKVNTFAVTINPVSFLSMRGGYCRENSSLSASIGISAEEISVLYGVRYHPYLGYSHSISVTYSSGPGNEPLDYRKTFVSPPAVKTDIRKASLDDLRQIEGISPRSAARIIDYREKIGPVNEKALAQIGLSNDEIKIIESNICGLERAQRNKEGRDYKKSRNEKKGKFMPRKERIKLKFRRMTAEGIPPFTAIKYSELCESADNDSFSTALEKDESLPVEHKSVIKKICAEHVR